MGATAETAPYIAWKEKAASDAKGRRVVHYYLKRSDGRADLVVVGKEKASKHMSYYYPMKDSKSLLFSKSSSFSKLRSRREVIDWLNSVVAGEQAYGSFRQRGNDMDGNLDFDKFEDAAKRNLRLYMPEFRWIGSPLAFRKRQTHYQSFCRNGVLISVQDFVYVLAEGNKRLVAYLDDMYEDNLGNKMVVVRWFHRIDEVGFVLPHNYNDREIFFSLCLQDLSVECIDGQATVLSPEHYEKFKDEATRLCSIDPFVCCKQFDNDDVQPFDITHMKGYWKQNFLKKMLSSSSLGKPFDEDLKVNPLLDDGVGFRPAKRIRRYGESEATLKLFKKIENIENPLVCGVASIDSKDNMGVNNLRKGCPSFLSEKDEVVLPSCQHHLSIGSEVEVLSQDSGMRGCWFRAVVIKKHKDKVKVQYQDIKDALEDAKNLEEWILASRIAAPDVLGVRFSGRAIVRPSASSEKAGGSSAIKLGSAVDAWWHDGWWEGVVVKNEYGDKLHVYFPGEKHEQIFSLVDLRQSREWINDEWKNMECRPELVSKLVEQKTPSCVNKLAQVKQENYGSGRRDDDLLSKGPKTSGCEAESDAKKRDGSETGRDLTKDDFLAQLRWKWSGKRRRSPVHKWRYSDCSGIQTLFVNPNPSMKFDSDNCKYSRDSHFSSSVVPSVTSLVMSR